MFMEETSEKSKPASLLDDERLVISEALD